MNSNNSKRGRNFDEFEKNLLVDLVGDFLDVIENKKTDGTTVKIKNKAWEDIAFKYNASCRTGLRTPKQLHALYDCIKKNARKALSNDKMEMYKTGGGTFVPKMNETSSKLVSLLKPQFEPICSSYDSTAEYLGDDHVIYSAENDVSTSSTGLCKDDAALLIITQESAEDMNVQVETAAEYVSNSPTPDVASLPFEVTPRIERTKKTPQKRQAEDTTNCSMKIKKDKTRIRLMEEEQSLKIKQMKEEHALKIQNMKEEHRIKMELWQCDLEIKKNQIQKEKN